MTTGEEAINNALRSYASVALSVTPTPIYRLERLSSCLKTDLWAMRDDLTGFALGGNKIRKLDFLIGDSLARASDTLVVSGASSFSRNAAAAGKIFGLQVHVIVAGQEVEQNQASMDFFAQFDAILHFAPSKDALPETQARLSRSLEERGRKVYELHPGGSDRIGTLGYVAAFGEICSYCQRSGVNFDRIIHPSGSAATQAGLVLGAAISGLDVRIVGVAISQPEKVQRERVRVLAAATANMLSVPFDESSIVVDDRFLGAGYPIPSKAGENAVALFATEEGLLLDQTYGGKAAAAVIAHAQEVGSAERTLFIHTGGNAGLYY